jgi:hypothetical protein
MEGKKLAIPVVLLAGFVFIVQPSPFSDKPVPINTAKPFALD